MSDRQVNTVRKVRDSYFDNYKAVLIMSVVLVHSITIFKSSFLPYAYIRDFLYIYAMPGFSFVSGYFCRKSDFKKNCRSLLVPYLIMQFVTILFTRFVWRMPWEKSILMPKFALWFLISLLIWRTVLPVVKDIPGILMMSFVLGVLFGYEVYAGGILSISRTVVFFPFFLMGHFFKKEPLMKFAQKWQAKLLAVILIVVIFFLVRENSEWIPHKLLMGSVRYREIEGIAFGWAWLWRIGYYMVCTLFIYLLAILMPAKKTFFSHVGQHTMPIYLSHTLIMRTISFCTDWGKYMGSVLSLVVVFALCIAYCFLIASKPVSFVLSWCQKKLMACWCGIWGLYLKIYQRLTGQLTE